MHDGWLVLQKYDFLCMIMLMGEVDRISQGLTQRVKLLAERYAQPLPVLSDRVKLSEDKVGKHLEKMGFVL